MKQAVICFTRVPRPEQTKTRLMPLLSPEQCVRLSWAFLRDLGKIYCKIDADLFVAYAPDPQWEDLKAVFPHARFLAQKGSDLGTRMYRTIRSVLELGYDRVILTGSDLPLMTENHLASGFAALDNADIALGPTMDGGYYLIGMKQPRKSVFQIEGYGGDTVTALPCNDVDTPEDLQQLAWVADPDSYTGRCLIQLAKEGISL